MTTPPTGDPRPHDLPPLDDVIQEAREGSWHLPETQPSEVAHPGDVVQAGEPPAPAKEGLRSATAAQAPAASSPSHAASPAGAHAGASGGNAATTQGGTAAAQATAAVHGSAASHGTAAAHATAAAAHGGGHGEDEGEPLGPIDVEAWGAGIAASIVGLIMTICFVLATSGVGAY